MLKFSDLDDKWFSTNCVTTDPQWASQLWFEWRNKKVDPDSNPMLCRKKLLTFVTGFHEQLVNNYCIGKGPQPNERKRALLAHFDQLIQHSSESPVIPKRNAHIRKVVFMMDDAVPSVTYHHVVTRGLCRAAAERRIDVKIHLVQPLTSQPSQELMNAVKMVALDFEVDALVMLRLTPENEAVEVLNRYRLPTVLIHANRIDYGSPVISNIVPDFRSVPPRLKELLANVPRGSKVVLVAAPEEQALGSLRDLRISAVKSGLADFDVVNVDVPDYSFHRAFSVFNRHRDAAAFVALSDPLAVAFRQLSFVADEGDAVPVVGFDGSELASEESVPSFQQNLSEIGRIVMTELCDVLPQLDPDRPWFRELTSRVDMTTHPDEIDNNKVESVLPLQWKPFHGFSLIFDHGEKNHTASGGILQARISEKILLYDALWECMQDFEKQFELQKRYQFCPLPVESYHVTFWDGVNVDNVSALNEPAQVQFNQLLPEIRDALPSLSRLFESESFPAEMINLTVRSVCQRGSALVANLEPSNGDDSGKLSEFADFRFQLSEAWYDEFGKPRLAPWQPHISLGYFANSRKANMYLSQNRELQNELLGQIRGLTLDLNRIRVYGFTDMATFFRLPD